MAESDEFLIVCMAYSLTWEIGGAHASQHWQGIRAYVQEHHGLTETERWACELYEESSPSAQEERSIMARINARLDHPRRVVDFHKAILRLLPESMAATAAKHRLMNSLALPQGYGRIRSWLAEHQFARLRPKPELPPLATREADFQSFIEHPYFVEGFRQFWHMPPKYRNNQQARILLCVGAALSQMLPGDDGDKVEEWSHRLGRMGNFTERTREDVVELCQMMFDASYDAQEIGYRLFVDAKEADRTAMVAFCERYADELSGFARELTRAIQLPL
jgi:hypothetical protein